jgi:hypothetical protein
MGHRLKTAVARPSSRIASGQAYHRIKFAVPDVVSGYDSTTVEIETTRRADSACVALVAHPMTSAACPLLGATW